ncbi:hypothetical protein Peur_060993 [Populus x canadensis]
MNNFHGTIPETFTEGNKIRSLDLNANELEGSLPRSLVNCKMLEVLVLRSDGLHGSIDNPIAISPFSSLRIIDLSHNDNQFEGQIPEEVGLLSSLVVLNFSMTSLIDLSSNRLSGEIPEQLTWLNFLAQIDSYVGNLRLCGYPLSVKCSNDVTPQPPPFQEKEDLASLFNWKFAMIGYGCGLLVGLIMGFIVFSTGKPQWFVRMV